MNTTRPYNRALLQADDFNLKDFIHLTRDIPFSRLSTCLNDHLNEVKKELGQLVNDEFNQFIRLYSDIGESGTQEIFNLESNMEILANNLRSLSIEVKGDYEDVTDLISCLSKLRSQENLFKKELEITIDLETLEDLFCRHEIGLASIHFIKIKNELLPLSNILPSAPELSKKLHEMLEKIALELESSTISAFDKSDSPEVLLLASFYVILDRFKEFEQLFIKHVTQPFCEKNITQQRLEGFLKSSSDKPGLVSLYDLVIEFLQSSEKSWIQPLSSIAPAGRSLASVLLVQPVLEQIMSELSIIFSPGIPDAFQHAYVASDYLLKKMTEIFEDESEAIKDSLAWKSFKKSWQVNIYYQLRYRDHVNQIEESLDIQLPLLSFSSQKKPVLSLDQIYQFKILRSSVAQLWEESCILSPLVTKIFKLTLQTCARYIDWLVSIPSEFAGTELGLSTAIIKAFQLYKLKDFIEHFHNETIVSYMKLHGWESNLFTGSLEKLLTTKLLDAKNYIDALVQKSLRLYFDRFNQNQLKGEFKSTVLVLENFEAALSFVEPEFIICCLNDAISDFSVAGTKAYEASQKVVTNIKRLQTVMKSPISPEDQSKLKEHIALKTYLEKEVQDLTAYADKLELNLDGLNALRDCINK